MRSTDNPGYLLHHLAMVLDRQSDTVLQDRFGIGFSQFKILMALKWHEGVQQKEIAKYLGQTEASVSRQIKLLHDLGLLQNRVSPKSRRERITTLTVKGNKVAEGAKEALNDYHGPLFEQLTPSQQEQYLEILGSMHDYVCRNNLNCKYK
jgi:DNA-binding MarR family transcriptional regulator